MTDPSHERPGEAGRLADRRHVGGGLWPPGDDPIPLPECSPATRRRRGTVQGASRARSIPPEDSIEVTSRRGTAPAPGRR